MNQLAKMKYGFLKVSAQQRALAIRKRQSTAALQNVAVIDAAEDALGFWSAALRPFSRTRTEADTYYCENVHPLGGFAAIGGRALCQSVLCS
jgi:hypothetical protein